MKQKTQTATVRRDGKPPGYFEYEVVGGFPPGRLREFQQTLLGAQGDYMLQILEVIEWIAPTDRQFDKARSRVLKLSNGHERTMREIIRHLLVKEEGSAEAR